MRTHGTLTKWNDERGFGFISPAQGSDDVFVHISAFPRDGVRPMLNELVSYETESGKDGKQRAVGIIRPGQKHRPRHSRESNHDSRPSGAFGVALVVLVVIAAGAYHYSRVRMTAAVHDETPAYLEAPDTPQDMSSFDCDGRIWCSQMTSCAEARQFLQHCPGTRMDGDNNGIPCERQWCN